MFFGWWSPMYLVFTVPPLLLALLAQAWVRSSYRKGLKVPSQGRVTGLEGARQMANQAGLGVRIDVISGELTDNYDPRDDTLRLSREVAQSPSVGALAIVAHELGHAMQDSDEYAPMQVRSALVGPVNIGTQLGTILFIAGMFMSAFAGLSGIGRLVSWVGILGFCLAVLFALITLPIEFNASRRGLALLTESGLVLGSQMSYARNVLYAAALTYIAALAQALGQVMYYVFLLSGRRRRR